MSQRSFCLTAAVLLGVLAAAAVVLLVLLHQERAWYAAAAVPPGAERTRQSLEFSTEFSSFYSAPDRERAWGAEFTDRQINSFLEEGLVPAGLDSHLLPDGVSQPRVAFEADHIRLGYRSGGGLFSSVISVDFRVWLPAKEPNVVALELEGMYAGVLPISAQSLLENAAEVGRKNGIDVTWYRHNGHPVALLRFQADKPRATFQLQAVQLQDHTITIQGRSLDPSPGRTTDVPSAAAAPN